MAGSHNPKSRSVSIPDRDLGILRHGEKRQFKVVNLVSIPDRDLGILRQLRSQSADSPRQVSIPDRDLGILRLCTDAGSLASVWFQSLIGI